MLVYESLLGAWPRAEPPDSSSRGRQAAIDRVKNAGAQGASADWVDVAGGPGQGAELLRRRSGRGQHHAAAAAASTTPQRRLLLLECLLGHPQAARLLGPQRRPPTFRRWCGCHQFLCTHLCIPCRLQAHKTRYLFTYLFISTACRAWALDTGMQGMLHPKRLGRK